MKFVLNWLLLCLFMAGCAAKPAQSATAAPVTTATFVVFTPSPEPSPTAVAALTEIPRPYVPFTAKTNAENVLLRANPGVRFEPKTTLTQGLELLVLYRAPGDEWIFVQTPFERTGWVNADLLTSEQSFLAAPLMQPPDVQVIVGRLLNERNEPVTGILFGILEDVEGARSFTVTTDSNGMFYAYLPLDSAGAWSVTFDKASCKSNTMDENCNCIGACGSAFPETQRVILPQKEMLLFQWR